MAHIVSNKSIVTVMLAVVFVVCCAGMEVFGQRGAYGMGDVQPGGYGQGQSGQPRRLTPQEKAEQDIQETAQLVDDLAVRFLQMVNNQDEPTDEEIEAAREVVDKGKRYAPKRWNDRLKSEVLILQAWSEYFGDDIQKAYLASKTGYQADRTNNDARATHTAISLLMDRKPIELPAEKPRATSRTNTAYPSSRTGRTGNYGMSAPYGGSTGGGSMKTSTGDILELDSDALDMELVGQTVSPMKLTCLNSTSLDYDPSQSGLCILFWQLSSKGGSGEPNDLSMRGAGNRPGRPLDPRNPGGYGNAAPGYGRPAPGYGNPGYDSRGYDGRSGQSRPPQESSYPRGDYGRPPYPQEPEYGYGMGGQRGGRGNPLVEQMEAYSQIFGSQIANPQVKFVAINTDSLTNAEAVVSRLLENPWPWANVMAANPASGAGQYADMNCKTPKLAIVDKTGKIRYAGPAAGFLAPMMLSEIAGKPDKMAPRPANVIEGGAFEMLRNLFAGAAENTATPRPVAPTTQSGGNQTTAEDDEEITPESYQAQKLLEYAKMFVSMGRKPVLTSKKGVDTCRQIIHDYPDRPEAQEARLLLRRVPERERLLYKITDEEMGL